MPSTGTPSGVGKRRDEGAFGGVSRDATVVSSRDAVAQASSARLSPCCLRVSGLGLRWRRRRRRDGGRNHRRDGDGRAAERVPRRRVHRSRSRTSRRPGASSASRGRPTSGPISRRTTFMSTGIPIRPKRSAMTRLRRGRPRVSGFRPATYPDFVTEGAVSTTKRAGSTTVCVTASDREHNVLDASIIDCEDVADLL